MVPRSLTEMLLLEQVLMMKFFETIGRAHFQNSKYAECLTYKILAVRKIRQARESNLRQFKADGYGDS